MNKNCGAPDIFRCAAAVLVIMIHALPFEQINMGLNFFTVHVLGRIAVPFFFMVTGQFTDFSSPWKHLKKTCVMYLAATALYIPLAVGGGALSDPWDIPKALFIDGIYYHLWYFPASIFGVILLYLLQKRLSSDKIFIVCTAVYALGLLGNSWFGLVENVPVLSDIYNEINSRIFMAPLFMAMGMAAGRREHFRPNICLTGFLTGFALMTAEAVFLKGFISDVEADRHSMYLFLPVTMWFLYGLLNAYPVKQRPYLRKITAVVYIIHPAVIGLARRIPINFISQNSLVRFIFSVLASFAAGALIHLAYQRLPALLVSCGKKKS